MKKTTTSWTISELSNQEFVHIDFPEYQREPNVWDRDAKQKLIDSILRRFDVASIYLYVDEDGTHSCIDGRQRINAIMSFLNENSEDLDNCFKLKISNEIENDEDNQFRELDGFTIEDIENYAGSGNAAAKNALERIYEYELTVVLLSDAARPAEFNLQFTRLNLGTIINAGEKLHAMVGQMRNLCFEDGRIGKHPFLESLNIPTRRFAKEQVAAQAVAQVFSLSEDKEFTRVRHVDLQRFFKRNAEIPDRAGAWIEDLASTFNTLSTCFPDAKQRLKNRAIAVSAVLFAWLRQMYQDEQLAETYAKFLRSFLGRLRWQLAKGFSMDEEYRYLLEFQRHVTQAAVERPAVQRRHEIIEKLFEFWMSNGEIEGDAVFRERGLGDPEDLCRRMILRR